MTAGSLTTPRDRGRITRPVLAWALYDVASSTYIAIVPSLVFPVYFTAVIAADHPDARALWGIVASVSLVVCGLVAPLAGAYADVRRARLGLLAAFTLLCCAATAALPLAHRGEILLAAALFIAAQVGYWVAMSLYDAYVGALAARAGGAERLSSFGFALGMSGGIAAILLTLAIASTGNGAGASDPTSYMRAFPLVAALFLGIALPALVGLRSVLVPSNRDIAAPEPRALSRLAATVRGWRDHHNVVRFLVGAYLINAAVVTVTVFAAIYFRDTFGVSVPDLLRLALLYHVVALPSTWLMGWFAHRTSVKVALAVALLIWTVAIVLMALGNGRGIAVTVIVLLGTVFASTQALLRGLYARIVPLGRAGELFGFNSFVGRIASAVGPLVFAWISASTGSARMALLAMLAFLVGGAIVLARVEPGETLPED